MPAADAEHLQGLRSTDRARVASTGNANAGNGCEAPQGLRSTCTCTHIRRDGEGLVRMNDTGGGNMPITIAKTGDIVRIIRITGDDSIRTHLAELGFAVGAEVKVVKAVKGNLILQVHGTRLALDQSMASRLLVEF